MLYFPLLRKKRTGSWKLYAVFFVIAIIIVIIALYFLFRHNGGSYIPSI